MGAMMKLNPTLASLSRTSSKHWIADQIYSVFLAEFFNLFELFFLILMMAVLQIKHLN